MAMTQRADYGERFNSYLSEIRRKAGESSFLTFCQVYLRKHFSCAASTMHREIGAILEDLSNKRGQRLVVAAPRSHAKSTLVSLAYVLWSICFEKEEYIVLISNTGDQANDLLGFVKDELKDNDLFIEDFPAAAEIPEMPPKAQRWRKNDIITRNHVKVTALGAEKKIRGRRHRQNRPTLIVLDDVENETQVRSSEQRQARRDWLHKAVAKSGAPTTNIIVVGTVLHYDSMLAQLLDERRSPGWIARKYQAVIAWSDRQDLWQAWENIYSRNAEHEGERGPEAAQRFYAANQEEMLRGTSVLWPEREDYRALMELRLREGKASFDSEKQNEPIDPDDCLFAESDMHFWDDDGTTPSELLQRFSGRPFVFGACDPSMGRHAGRGDFTAIVTLLMDGDSRRLYVLDADIRRRKPDETIDAIISLHSRYCYNCFVMEGNQFQGFVASELYRRAAIHGLDLPLQDVASTTDKVLRIGRLQPMIRSGQIMLSRRHTLLIDQLRHFPKGAHDDGPDALELAVKAALGFRTRPRIFWVELPPLPG